MAVGSSANVRYARDIEELPIDTLALHIIETPFPFNVDFVAQLRSLTIMSQHIADVGEMADAKQGILDRLQHLHIIGPINYAEDDDISQMVDLLAMCHNLKSVELPYYGRLVYETLSALPTTTEDLRLRWAPDRYEDAETPETGEIRTILGEPTELPKLRFFSLEMSWIRFRASLGTACSIMDDENPLPDAKLAAAKASVTVASSPVARWEARKSLYEVQDEREFALDDCVFAMELDWRFILDARGVDYIISPFKPERQQRRRAKAQMGVRYVHDKHDIGDSRMGRLIAYRLPDILLCHTNPFEVRLTTDQWCAGSDLSSDNSSASLHLTSH
ncbi:hypothetical protein EMMF5_000296 [Cystobasidiomycetes sp. EMM_F5]